MEATLICITALGTTPRAASEPREKTDEGPGALRGGSALAWQERHWPGGENLRGEGCRKPRPPQHAHSGKVLILVVLKGPGSPRELRDFPGSTTSTQRKADRGREQKV